MLVTYNEYMHRPFEFIDNWALKELKSAAVEASHSKQKVSPFLDLVKVLCLLAFASFHTFVMSLL
jgi:hypothetical protein